ncbi:antibiotic biosynthesis monooxygenase [Algoriphagus sp. SE2]|uniref:putative quinol monooxygenase n=1 Tax=Algoriphagus sp. SE2 TaxID=3141536 RepID=UPI0031CD7800
MKNIHLIARFHIHPGKESEFKDLIPQCIARVKANETGAERYEWYLNEEGTVCHVLETYKNSDAVLAHITNVGELLGKIFQISDFSGDMYGNLSEELQAAIETLPITRNSLYQSM